jgi:4-diphosphocytidyl-2-C-methyl-D-erythritol kinase
MRNSRFAPNPSSFVLRAPAKINWFLNITGKRNDGYHNILSLIQSIGLYDELTFAQADGLDLISDMDIPPEENLVCKAASALGKRVSCYKGARISLKKNIPSGAGLGGGSSDAACTLKGLNMLWKLKLGGTELSSIAAETGSDVPFFLQDPCSLVEGRGEILKPLKVLSSTVLLLVKPSVSVSTSWAYASYDSLPKLTKKAIDIKLLIQALNRQDFAALDTLINNDLEYAVAERYPVIKDIKTQLMQSGAMLSAMTGSGSAVFGVFQNREKAEKAAKTMQLHWCKVVETLI